MEIVLKLIGLGVFAQSLTWAKPFRVMLEWMGLDNHQQALSRAGRFFQELFACEMCMGFWVGVFWCWNIPEAALVMLFARLTRALYDVLPMRI